MLALVSGGLGRSKAFKARRRTKLAKLRSTHESTRSQLVIVPSVAFRSLCLLNGGMSVDSVKIWTDLHLDLS